MADFFSGSGTTAAVAERLSRKWIITDIGSKAIQVSKNRILDILHNKYEAKEKVNSFDVLCFNENKSFNEHSFDFRIKTNIKDHKISIELVDFVPIGNKYLSQGKKEVNLSWSDWIDSWAIDFNYNSLSKCFKRNVI